MNTKYKQDQRVYFKMGNGKPEGWGTIAGVQGFVIIVRPEQPVTDYEYSHIYLVDSQITEDVPPVVEPELDDGL